MKAQFSRQSVCIFGGHGAVNVCVCVVRSSDILSVFDDIGDMRNNYGTLFINLSPPPVPASLTLQLLNSQKHSYMIPTQNAFLCFNGFTNFDGYLK